MDILSELNLTELRLLIALWKHMDSQYRCYPSCKTLMKLCGIKSRHWKQFTTAREGLKRLGLRWRRTRHTTIWEWELESTENVDSNILQETTADVDSESNSEPTRDVAQEPTEDVGQTNHLTKPNDDNNDIIMFWKKFKELHKETEKGSYSKRRSDDERLQVFLSDANLDDVRECLRRFPEYLNKERLKEPNLDFCIAVFIGACTHKGGLLKKIEKERKNREKAEKQREREGTPEYWEEILAWLEEQRQKRAEIYPGEKEPTGTFEVRPDEHLSFQEAKALCERKLSEIMKAKASDC